MNVLKPLYHLFIGIGLAFLLGLALFLLSFSAQAQAPEMGSAGPLQIPDAMPQQGDSYEPNDTFATAYNVGVITPTGTPVALNDARIGVAPNNVRDSDDYYRATFSVPGDIFVGISRSPGDTEPLTVALLDAQGKVLQQKVSSGPLTMVERNLPAGDYVLHIAYSGNAWALYGIGWFYDQPDPYEPNDTFQTAYRAGTISLSGGPLYLLGPWVGMWPDGVYDRDDYYRATFSSAGDMSIGIGRAPDTESEPLLVALLDSSGAVRYQQTVTGHPFIVVPNLPADDYVLHMSYSGNKRVDYNITWFYEIPTPTPTPTSTPTPTPTSTPTWTPTPTPTVVNCPNETYEPNNTSSQAYSITTPITLTAALCPLGDEDWYRVVLSRGEEILAELDQLLEDYNMAITDAQGNILINGAVSGPYPEAVAYTAQSDGVYMIKVYPTTGPSNLPVWSRSPYRLRVQKRPTCLDRYEPNDAYGKAFQISTPITLTATLCPQGDEDWYSASLSRGEEVAVLMVRPISAVPYDYYLALYDPQGKRVAYDETDGWDGRHNVYMAGVVHTALIDGVYKVRVYPKQLAQGGPEWSHLPYQLNVHKKPTCIDKGGVLKPGKVVQARICPQGDKDLYTFSTQNVPGNVHVLIVLEDLPANYDLLLRDGRNKTISSSTNPGRTPEVITATIQANSTYTISVVGNTTTDWSWKPYRLSLHVRQFTQIKSSNGGALRTNDGITLTFPAGSVQGTTTITYTPQFTPTRSTGTFRFAGRSFHITATDANGNPVSTFKKPFTLTLTYADWEWRRMRINDETILNLAYYDVSQQKWVNILPCQGCSLDTQKNEITVVLNHLTEFALLAPPPRLFMPMIVR